MAELRIIGTPHSNFTSTCRIVCIEKGVPHVFDQRRPHSPEVDSINPFGLIPVMRHGDVQLFECRAICRYIDRVFEGPSIVPSDPEKEALTEQWVSAVTTSIDQLLMRRFLQRYTRPGPDGTPDQAAISAALSDMSVKFSMLDHAVEKTGYLVGDEFTLADAYLVPILFFVTKLPNSAELLAQNSSLQNYWEKHRKRASIQDTSPLPDYEPTPAYYARFSKQ